MTFNLARACAQFLSRLCDTCNMYLKTSGKVSVNEVDAIWLKDGIERSVCLFSCYFAPNWPLT